MRRFVSWTKEILKWLWDARLGIICILVLVVAFLLCFNIWPTEFSIRLSGLVLQILGMFLAIRGLLRIRFYFRHPPILELIRGWFERFPKWVNNRVINLKGSISNSSSVSGNISIWTSDNPEDPVEKRIEAILKNLDRLQESQRKNYQTIRLIQTDFDKYKKDADKRMTKTEQKIQSDLESLHTDDILASLVGLIWLTVGICLSTMSQEFYGWFIK